MVRTCFRCAVAATAVTLVLASVGCVRRTITITSDPSGALVFVNEREVGRTPVEIEFVYYGTYDVRLLKDGFEPLVTSGDAKPPLWDTIPLDLGAELLPGTYESKVAWHYELQPLDDDPARLLERADAMRSEVAAIEAEDEAEQAAEAADAAAAGDG